MKSPLNSETEARTLIRTGYLIGAIKLLREMNPEISSLLEAKRIVEDWRDEMDSQIKNLPKTRIRRAMVHISGALDAMRSYENAELDKLPPGSYDANDQIENARAVIDKLLGALETLELLS